MNKSQLIKHIKGELSHQERKEVVSWIDQSEQNEKYYLGLMQTVALEEATRENLESNLSGQDKEEALISIKEKTGLGKVRRGSIGYKRSFAWAFSAAAVLLFISVGLNVLQFLDDRSGIGVDIVHSPEEVAATVAHEAKARNAMQTFYTENGVKAKIVLPDSSVVWLNSASSITYPQCFAEDCRNVEFRGEGYFDVTRNEKAPMVVSTPRGMKITVLGTKFHIYSYDESDEQATLFSGKINVSKVLNNKVVVKERSIKPLESVSFENVDKVTLTQNADTTNKVAWKRGELIFDKTPMPQLIKKLERWHGVNIVVRDSSVLKYKFTAKFRSESVVQVLELLTFTAPVDFSIENNQVFLSERKK